MIEKGIPAIRLRKDGFDISKRDDVDILIKSHVSDIQSCGLHYHALPGHIGKTFVSACVEWNSVPTCIVGE